MHYEDFKKEVEKVMKEALSPTDEKVFQHNAEIISDVSWRALGRLRQKKICSF